MGPLGGSPPPVVTKIKQLFITGKERRSVGVMLGPVGAFGGCWGGVGGLGGLGGTPPVVTKKELDTTRKQRGEGGVSSNSKFKI